jgi:predicted kinase
MPGVHLVFGPVGAGKTTYGRRLAKERAALFIALDDWISTLFGKDAPEPVTLEWGLERTARCEAQIWKLCRDVCALDRDVILELGFFKHEQRARFRRLAADAGLTVQNHFVTADQEVRRRRVRQRNLGSETLTVRVDDAMFDWSEGYFEAPTEDELRGAVVIDGKP